MFKLKLEEEEKENKRRKIGKRESVFSQQSNWTLTIETRFSEQPKLTINWDNAWKGENWREKS